MTGTNPQIEEQLNKLAELCCRSMESGQAVVNDQSEALLKAMLMSGYARKEGRSLQSELEARVKDRCREPAMHRGGALSSISAQLQEKLDELARWESRQPDSDDKAKAANISSPTDA